jgi:radical SAM superfamily enzyme YgiQ (UPF0313 family)
MSYEVILVGGQAPSNLIYSKFAGPHRLATELRQNHIPTKVLYGLGYFSARELLELISSFITERTLLIGFSTTFLISYSPRAATLDRLHTGNRYIADLEFILNSIKALHPKIRIVLGGPSARNILTDLSNVDLLVEGYADTWIVDYVLALKAKGWQPEPLTHKNVPLILNPKNSGFHFRSSKITFTMEDGMIPGETLPLEVSRGCIFNCKFCSYPLRNKSINDPSLLKDSALLEEELLRNFDQFQITNYLILDDTFNDSMEKLRKLHGVFTKLPFRIKFAAYIRPDLLYTHPESISLLYEIGIKGAFFGVESLDKKARRMALKGFDSDLLLKTLEQVNREWPDVFKTSSFIYGLPGETPKTMENWTDDIIFGSGIFEKHDLIFTALYLKEKGSAFISDFDQELEKYDYRFETKSPYWVSPVTTYREMFAFANSSNLRAAATHRPHSNFNAVSLLGYGFTEKEVWNLDSHRNEDNARIEEFTKRRYKDYAKRVAKK